MPEKRDTQQPTTTELVSNLRNAVQPPSGLRSLLGQPDKPGVIMKKVEQFNAQDFIQAAKDGTPYNGR